MYRLTIKAEIADEDEVRLALRIPDEIAKGKYLLNVQFLNAEAGDDGRCDLSSRLIINDNCSAKVNGRPIASTDIRWEEIGQ